MHYTQPKSVILIPQWILTLLERDGCSISDILNLDKVSKVLSSEELAGILLLNDGYREDPYHKVVFGVDPNAIVFADEGEEAYVSQSTRTLSSLWWNYPSDPYAGLQQYRALYPLIESTLKSRLFDDGALTVRPTDGIENVIQIKQTLEKSKPYTLVDSDRCVFVVLQPYAFPLDINSPYSKVLREYLIEDLLTLLHTYRHLGERQIREMECTYIDNISKGNADS